MSQQTLTTHGNRATVTPDCPSGCPYDAGVQVEATARWHSAGWFPWFDLEWDATGITLDTKQRQANPLTFTMPDNPVALTATVSPIWDRWLKRG